MLILFPSQPCEYNKPDTSFEVEVKAAINAGFDVGYIGLETYFGDKVTLHHVPKSSCGPVIYRGWILKPQDYMRMTEELAKRGGQLVTSLDQYMHCYHFPNWYGCMGADLTPRSIWFEGPNFDLDNISNIVSKEFGSSGLIIKDYIKSRKHDWYNSCYIASAQDANEVKRVTTNFIDGQGEYLVGGLVYREFINLRKIGLHSKSRLPLVNEHRFFVLNGKPLYQAPYWFEGDYSGAAPTQDIISPILSKVQSSFYAVDVAEKEDGSWVIVELNDGGSAGIPEGGSAVEFFNVLKTRLENNDV